MTQILKAENKVWWKEAVVYQIYPRSFKDTTGNGVGDLRGIIQQLDYITSLGVDAVWLNPIYPSPNDDGGYDISDFTGIQPEFGDMQDFDELLNGLHDRGIKLIMDLVLNHSSDEHAWFEESRKSKDNPYRNYYIWRPGQDGGPPNNWPSFFGGSAWAYDAHTDEYYLHLFSKKQPDLNWEFDPVREEVNKLIRFWLERGVDGLRLDVISLISKRLSFSNSDTDNFHDIIQHHYANGPRMKEFLSQMRKEVFDQYHTFTIGEGPGITPKEVMDYLDPEHGLSIIFHFEHMLLDQGPGGRFDPRPWNLSDFKAICKTWDDAIEDKGWTSIFLGNHDYPRMVSRWGNDKEYRVQSAKMLITLLLTLRGTPFIFQGDELGMTNLTLSKVSESKDIETHAGWKQSQQEGKSEADFLRIANITGRDNARSPMQWSLSHEAGFTSGKPWMMVNPNHTEINVDRQESDPESVLNFFRRMVATKKSNPVLTHGKFEIVESREPTLFMFHRIFEDEKWMVALNFSSNTVPFPFEPEFEMKRVIGNYDTSEAGFMRPWEALVYKV